MHVNGSQALFDAVHQSGLCVGCGACVDLCPYFKTYKGKTARVFPCDRETGRCHAHCPKTEVDLDHLARQRGGNGYPASPLGAFQSIVAARAGARYSDQDSQCGGTVSALVAFALDQGIIEAAVLTDRDGLDPVPVLATGPEDVRRCAGSKYTAAPTLAALNRAAGQGQGNLAVVGTPCQLTAVAQMRANPLQTKDFTDPVALTLGLFCTWALDTRQLTALLCHEMDVNAIRKMDIPPPPAEVMVLDTDQGRKEIPLSRLRPLIPEGCGICPDMTAEWADLSVGALEGEPGWNTLIIRTKAGLSLVEQALAQGWLETIDYPDGALGRLTEAAGAKKRRALRKADTRGLVNTDPETAPSVLRLAPATLAAILGATEKTP